MINRENLQLNDNIKKMDAKDSYRTFHQNTKEYICFLKVKELSSKPTTYEETKQISTNARKLD